MDAISNPRIGAEVLFAVILRPKLWLVAIRQLFRLAPARWWARRPFLPLPTRAYLAFRTQTQYGSGQTKVETKDVLSYLHWLRDFR